MRAAPTFAKAPTGLPANAPDGIERVIALSKKHVALSQGGARGRHLMRRSS